MKPGHFHLIDAIGRSVDTDMSMTEIVKVIARMSDCYPSVESQRLARALAAELGEVYLDKMCQQFMQSPLWQDKDTPS